MNLGVEGVHWYGGTNLMNLEWPMHKEDSYNMSEFVLNDIYQFVNNFNNFN